MALSSLNLIAWRWRGRISPWADWDACSLAGVCRPTCLCRSPSPCSTPFELGRFKCLLPLLVVVGNSLFFRAQAHRPDEAWIILTQVLGSIWLEPHGGADLRARSRCW